MSRRLSNLARNLKIGRLTPLTGQHEANLSILQSAAQCLCPVQCYSSSLPVKVWLYGDCGNPVCVWKRRPAAPNTSDVQWRLFTANATRGVVVNATDVVVARGGG